MPQSVFPSMDRLPNCPHTLASAQEKGRISYSTSQWPLRVLVGGMLAECVLVSCNLVTAADHNDGKTWFAHAAPVDYHHLFIKRLLRCLLQIDGRCLS